MQIFISYIVSLANSLRNIRKGHKNHKKSEKVKLKDFFPGVSYQILDQCVTFFYSANDV